MEENVDFRNERFSDDEKEFEQKLRPVNFSDFAGQTKITDNLKVFVEAAKMRSEALDHVLFHGPPGLGKTTLSYIIASELDVGIKVTSGPVLDKAGDLAGLLTGLDESAGEISNRRRGTPRIANALLRRVRDFAQVKSNGDIDLDITKYGLDALNIDANGLDHMDNRILVALVEKFKGRPVGLSTLAISVGEEPGTIEEVYEPFLIQEGFIRRTPRGREATERAFAHLGKIPDVDQKLLF